jgi:hypothetical protein
VSRVTEKSDSLCLEPMECQRVGDLRATIVVQTTPVWTAAFEGVGSS